MRQKYYLIGGPLDGFRGHYEPGFEREIVVNYHIGGRLVSGELYETICPTPALTPDGFTRLYHRGQTVPHPAPRGGMINL